MEEFGLIFGLFIVFLYPVFYIISKNSNNSPSNLFIENTTFCLCFILCIQAFINIGSSINLIPPTGMTLPFVSYGGSSMLSYALIFGTVINFLKMKKVLLITHHETSNLGIISKILSKKYLITSIYFKNIKNLGSNELLGYSAYIFFGGKMSANSQSEVINNEFIFLKKLIKSNKLIIGICLGAQLIAKIYGSKIYKNKNNLVEIGYRKLDKINKKFFKNVLSMLQFHNEGITYNSHMSIYAKGRNFEIDAFKIKKKKFMVFNFILK